MIVAKLKSGKDREKMVCPFHIMELYVYQLCNNIALTIASISQQIRKTMTFFMSFEED